MSLMHAKYDMQLEDITISQVYDLQRIFIAQFVQLILIFLLCIAICTMDFKLRDTYKEWSLLEKVFIDDYK